MLPKSSEGIPARGAVTTIVNDQRGAATLLDPAGDILSKEEALGTRFDDGSNGKRVKCLGVWIVVADDRFAAVVNAQYRAESGSRVRREDEAQAWHLFAFLFGGR
mmetsp:Transcript_22738/g.35761  ORF Transcript_22738/g.35761 Transcript_22738/m.35761 type:complete len:105 (-) Transcript_22738:323-637(-)